MAGYTRNDTSNNIATGNVINAADLDGEFDALVAAFHASTGHTHDGTAANGAPITKIGPAQDLVISTGAITPKTDNTVDLGSSSFEFKDLYIDGTANIDALVADTADINAGTIDGVVIGGSTTAAGSFTTLTTSSTVTLNGGTANGVLYLNGSKVATSGSALTFDGTALAPDGTGRTLGTTALRWGTVYASAFADGTDQLVGSAGAQARFGYGASWTSQAFAIGGTEQMRLTTTGLGIGTSSPLVKFDVKVTTDTHVGIAATGIDEALILAYDDAGVRTPNLNYAAASHKFLIASTEAMRLDASGNLGLGVTPSAWNSSWKALELSTGAAVSGRSDNSTIAYLQANSYRGASNWIYRTTGVSTLYAQDTGQHQWYTAPSGTAGNAITFTQAMTLDASGNLGVGTTSPATKFNVSDSSTNCTITVTNSSSNFQVQSNSNDGYFNLNGSGNIIFRSGTPSVTERARITSGGQLLVGTTTSSSSLSRFSWATNARTVEIENTNASLTTDAHLFLYTERNTTNNSYYYFGCYNGTAGAWKLRIADSGDVTNTNGTYGTISDAKMKTDIVDAGSQWADIKAIRFRKFKMKDDPSGLLQLGVVAQELEQTSPGLVDEHVDRDAEGNDLGTTTKSVKTSILLMKAAKALQEAMARIETLEAKVSALEGN